MDVTYVQGNRLYATISDNAKRTCLLESGPEDGESLLSWGPRAERVLLAHDNAVLPSGKKISPFESITRAVWSRPEGKSILGVTSKGQLLKRRTIEPEAVDISFLKRHEEAIYHPAGTHIVSIGTDSKDNYGLFMATNLGKDLKQLAIAERAERIFSLIAGPDGKNVYFAADHGSYREIHSLELDPPGLGTVYTTNDQIVRITEVLAKHPAPAIAVQLGSCAKDTSVVVVHLGTDQVDGVFGFPAGASVDPVGWLPDGTLVLLKRDEGCAGPGALYLAPSSGEGNSSNDIRYGMRVTLLASRVQSAGVRVVAPPPGSPPGSPTDPPVA